MAGCSTATVRRKQKWVQVLGYDKIEGAEGKYSIGVKTAIARLICSSVSITCFGSLPSCSLFGGAEATLVYSWVRQ